MEYSNKQLKAALAKLLPKKVVFATWTPYGGTEEQHSLLYLENGLRADRVHEDALLYLCSLAENELDVNIESGDSPRYAYARELYNLTPQGEQPFRASWQRRVIALCRVRRITI